MFLTFELYVFKRKKQIFFFINYYGDTLHSFFGYIRNLMHSNRIYMHIYVYISLCSSLHDYIIGSSAELCAIDTRETSKLYRSRATMTFKVRFHIACNIYSIQINSVLLISGNKTITLLFLTPNKMKTTTYRYFYGEWVCGLAFEQV